MKRRLSFILVFVLLLMVPKVAYAQENIEANNTSGHLSQDSELIIEYSIVDDIVNETCYYYENGILQFTLVKMVYPDNTFIAYKNGIIVYRGETEYSIFVAYANGSVQGVVDSPASNTRQVYYPCGETDLHTLVDSSTETIDLDVYYAANDIVAFLLSIKLGPAGPAYQTILSAATRISQLDADYVTVTQYKFFVQNNTLMTAYNCYHNYYTAYNESASGSTQTVDAWSTYYKELI